jgi:hypothetical protein
LRLDASRSTSARGDLIRRKLGFRFVSVPDKRTALDLETAVKTGALGARPYLQNPVED